MFQRKKKNKNSKPVQLELFNKLGLKNKGACSLSSILSKKLKRPIKLLITNNRRTVISVKETGSGFEIRLNYVFLEADKKIISALADLIKKKNNSAQKVIRRFILESQDKIVSQKPNRSLRIEPKGKVYELDKLLKKVSKDYKLPINGLKISWSKARFRQGQHTIKFGAYDGEQGLIRVHPVLDRKNVPMYFVEYIIYHELLHSITSYKIRKGRRIFHTDEFKEREQKFRHFKKAREWEKRYAERYLS